MIQYPIDVDSTSTRILEAGAGGRPLLLVHGVGARADRWAGVIDDLAGAGHHAVALDLPGHGLATKGPGLSYDIDGFAAFIGAAIGVLGFDGLRPTLVGTSMGGHACARLVTSSPGLAGALVLVGSLGLAPWGVERRTAIRERLTDVSEAGVRRKLAVLLHDPALITDAWVREERMVNGSPGAAESFAAIARYIADRLNDDLVLDDLVAMPGRPPVLLVWGAEERSVPVEVGRSAHAVLSGSELVEIDGAAHAPYVEAPQRFVHALTDFLSRHPAAAPDG